VVVDRIDHLVLLHYLVSNGAVELYKE